MAGELVYVIEDGREAGPHWVKYGDGSTFDLVPAPEMGRSECDYILTIGEPA